MRLSVAVGAFLLGSMLAVVPGAAAPGAAAPGAALNGCPPAYAGFYSATQAASGKAIFDTHCSACHAATLTGGAGPPLSGSQFVSWLQFTKITGAQLFAFITSQMPYDAPGSLTRTDYEDAFAYILSVNHYPAGSAALSQNSVACVEMLPYPKQN
ncbi:MAG: c-type cytochrome [Acetobacteraceae bacterium]